MIVFESEENENENENLINLPDNNDIPGFDKNLEQNVIASEENLSIEFIDEVKKQYIIIFSNKKLIQIKFSFRARNQMFQRISR